MKLMVGKLNRYGISQFHSSITRNPETNDANANITIISIPNKNPFVSLIKKSSMWTWRELNPRPNQFAIRNVYMLKRGCMVTAFPPDCFI